MKKDCFEVLERSKSDKLLTMINISKRSSRSWPDLQKSAWIKEIIDVKPPEIRLDFDKWNMLDEIRIFIEKYITPLGEESDWINDKVYFIDFETVDHYWGLHLFQILLNLGANVIIARYDLNNKFYKWDEIKFM